MTEKKMEGKPIWISDPGKKRGNNVYYEEDSTKKTKHQNV